MLRSANQTRAAERSAVGYVNRSYFLDGVLWRFWSMAPGRKDHHWVTDGARFVLATDAGLLDVRDPRWHVHRTLEELKDQGRNWLCGWLTTSSPAAATRHPAVWLCWRPRSDLRHSVPRR